MLTKVYTESIEFVYIPSLESPYTDKSFPMMKIVLLTKVYTGLIDTILCYLILFFALVFQSREGIVRGTHTMNTYVALVL